MTRASVTSAVSGSRVMRGAGARNITTMTGTREGTACAKVATGTKIGVLTEAVEPSGKGIPGGGETGRLVAKGGPVMRVRRGLGPLGPLGGQEVSQIMTMSKKSMGGGVAKLRLARRSTLMAQLPRRGICSTA